MKNSYSTTVILLAGGKGTRFKGVIPKQFLTLVNKPIALYSMECFASIAGVAEIVVVCDPIYQDIFTSFPCNIPLTFALPGERRQDSVYNGFMARENRNTDLICIHDTARPFITCETALLVLETAFLYEAATVGVPVQATIKEINEHNFVVHTPDRSRLWEIQTPQVIHPDLLSKGFALVNELDLTVTDDVTLVEIQGHPVKIVRGEYSNIKITNREDLALAEQLALKNTYERV